LRDCYFDDKVSEGLETLKQYQREYDEDKKCFKDKARHDWTSHYADAFRYACLVWREELKPKELPEPRFPQHRTFAEIMAKQKRRRSENE
jgi:hypothetical protein